jgi:hypothetical protein
VGATRATGFTEAPVQTLQRGSGGKKTGYGEDRDAEAQLLQPVRRQERRTPAFDHVGEQRNVEVATDPGHLCFALRRFDEENVGASLHVGFAASQRLIQTQGAARVCACNDQELRIATGFDRDFDPSAHILDGDDSPAGGVPAFLGEFLVLELNRRGAGGLVATHRAANVEQASVACVAVGDKRRLRHCGHGAHSPNHLGIGREPRVRQAQMRCGYAVTRHVQRFEAHDVGEP